MVPDHAKATIPPPMLERMRRIALSPDCAWSLDDYATKLTD